MAIRHAPVDAEGRCYGQLDLRTAMRADEAAERMWTRAAELGPDVVWSSDACRCAEPAALLADRLGREHRVDHRLRELAYGAWEGLAWSAILPAELDAWMRDWVLGAPPGGESATALADRVADWWSSLAPGRHLVVAHAGVLHALDVVADGATWDEAMRRRHAFLEPVTYRGGREDR